MRLYNTLSRSIDQLEPINPPQIGFYACGFTVYDFTHLGHLRKYTMDDVLLRTLQAVGYQVKLVQNITDVGHLTSDSDTGEDKLEKGARKYGKSAWDLAREFEEYFWRSMDLMGNKRPDVSCRATEHIEEQLALVKTLEEKGFTYVIEGDGVYFDTSKIDDYGKLATIDMQQLMEGARIERVPGKKNTTDFALWKFERAGENRAMIWASPWAERSFPGWHVECSAMSMKYLGEQFEIHSGGIDHVNVHHTNEIAQSEAATGKKPFVRYWIHHNFLSIEGEKMSKSLGNFFTIDDVLKRGFDPKALRLLLLSSHYRSEMNFTWNSLEGMQKTYQRLVAQALSLKQERGRTVLSDDKLQQIDAYRQKFVSAMTDDLKTPEALATMWEMLKSNIPGPDKYDLLTEFDEYLGLGIGSITPEMAQQLLQKETKIEELPEQIQELLRQRQAARETGNWAVSDQLRDQLSELGYQVRDQQNQQEVIKLK